MDKNLLEKCILKILSGEPADEKINVIGKICLVRTYSAGVHFGEVIQLDGTQCILKDSRRIYNWEGATCCSQLAMEGAKKTKETRVTMPNKLIVLTQAIEIIPMTSSAINNLKIDCEQWKSQ